MGTLNASLAIALSGLSAEQGAMQATSNNVANVNTPGYSRQVAQMVASDPVVVDPLTLGTGVTLRRIDSVRDAVLEIQIGQETETGGKYGALVTALSQAESNFSSTTADIGTAISKFFDSINQLSTSPTDLSLRQSVLTAAGNVARAFNTASGNLTTQRSNLNQNVEQTAGQINQLTAQIAQLNGQIANLENAGEDAGTFLDQRGHLIEQLSSLVDVAVIPSDRSITLTTASGAALVVGSQSFVLTTQPDSSGMERVYSQGNDLTGVLVGGQLAGLLEARDQQIPAIVDQLDTLAAGFANAVNAVQTSGYDLNGNLATGSNLFVPPAATAGAAAGLAVAISDPKLIAASADGTVGSNGNAELLYAIRNQGVIAGQSPTDYYSGIVFQVGNASANAKAAESASELVLQKLKDERAAVSGVSLDEEAANMMRYQQAYAASAQVVRTIQDMMQVVINMKS